MSAQVGLGVFASLESQSLTQGGEFVSSDNFVCFTFWLCQILPCVVLVCCYIYTCLGFFCPFVVVQCLFITGDNPCLRPWHGQCVHDLSFYLKRVSYGDPVVHLGLTVGVFNLIAFHVIVETSGFYILSPFCIFSLSSFFSGVFWIRRFYSISSPVFFGGAASGFTNFIFRFS